jgi:tRNA dimethylallyltransferase
MSFRVLFIIGPTASGKSQIALEIAAKHSAVIINCDSIQVYKELSIGAAKPRSEDFQKVPHYLYDFINYPREYTAGDYTRDFKNTLDSVKDKYPLAIVVGGTGFYFQAIEKGMFDAGKADPLVMEKIRVELEEVGGSQRLYAELLSVDPESARIIHANDHYRLQRALGVWRTMGKSMSQLRKEMEQQMEQQKFAFPLNKFGIQIEKIELESRIRQRVLKMIKDGLIDEVENLKNKNYLNWAPLQSVGYRETIEFLEGKIKTKSRLVDSIVISTRQLAKKQRTWFQRDLKIAWIEPSKAVNTIETILALGD